MSFSAISSVCGLLLCLSAGRSRAKICPICDTATNLACWNVYSSKLVTSITKVSSLAFKKAKSSDKSGSSMFDWSNKSINFFTLHCSMHKQFCLTTSLKQPKTACHLILHLVLATGSAQGAVQILHKLFDSVHFVKSHPVEVNSEEHLKTPAQGLLVGVLFDQALSEPLNKVSQLFVGHSFARPACQFGQYARHLMHQIVVLQVQHFAQCLVDVFFVFARVLVEQVNSIFVLNKQVIN
ncbi:hypothetical protein BpHYR1_032653 [Brachionus plicatilis]|uniref:Secreted protein n=1 Tax=Brachionus plicatilis TaxID=10195 RepID=A0A3M7RDM1_BRAPC|nr:hypothetical protein BpHYR1_032653 [Brachionus plicatilis]